MLNARHRDPARCRHRVHSGGPITLNCAGSSVIEAFASLSIGIRVQSVSVATIIAMGSHWQAALVESRGTITTAYPARSLWMG